MGKRGIALAFALALVAGCAPASFDRAPSARDHVIMAERKPGGGGFLPPIRPGLTDAAKAKGIIRGVIDERLRELGAAPTSDGWYEFSALKIGTAAADPHLSAVSGRLWVRPANNLGVLAGINVESISVGGVTGVYPQFDSYSVLGSASLAWSHVYADALTLGQSGAGTFSWNGSYGSFSSAMTFNGSIATSGHAYPSVDSTYDLGFGASLAWRNTYSHTLTLGISGAPTLTASGSTAVASGSLSVGGDTLTIGASLGVPSLLVASGSGVLSTSSYLTVTSQVTGNSFVSVGGYLAGNGSVSSPAYAFSGDADTGIYHTGTSGQMILASDGAAKLLIYPTTVIVDQVPFTGNLGNETISNFARKITNQSSDKTIAQYYENTVHWTNIGATGTVTRTLPDDPVIGMRVMVSRVASFAVRVLPNTGDKILDADMTGLADEEYIEATADNSYIELEALSTDDWLVVRKLGTWVEETP